MSKLSDHTQRITEAQGVFCWRFGWAPSSEVAGGRVYEDLEGSEPGSVVVGAEEPEDLAGWDRLWLRAMEAEAATAARRAARLAEYDRAMAESARRRCPRCGGGERFERDYVASGPHFD